MARHGEEPKPKSGEWGRALQYSLTHKEKKERKGKLYN